MLQNIASNSNGGTFTFVDTEETETSKNFIQTVSNVVAGQMDRLVVAEDLHLTITNIESTIKKVSAGNFPQCWDESSVTITFGALHCKEKFSVSVDLLLDEVSKSRGTDVVEFSYCYHDRYVTNFFPYLFLIFCEILYMFPLRNGCGLESCPSVIEGYPGVVNCTRTNVSYPRGGCEETPSYTQVS